MAIARQHSSGAREEWRQEGKVYRLSHRLVTRPVGMESVTGAADRAVRLESGTQAAGRRVESRSIEVDDTIKAARGADKGVDDPPFGIDFRRAVGRRAAQGRDDRRAKDPETAHAAAPDDLAHPGDDRIRPAAAAEIVDSF